MSEQAKKTRNRKPSGLRPHLFRISDEDVEFLRAEDARIKGKKKGNASRALRRLIKERRWEVEGEVIESPRNDVHELVRLVAFMPGEKVQDMIDYAKAISEP